MEGIGIPPAAKENSHEKHYSKTYKEGLYSEKEFFFIEKLLFLFWRRGSGPSVLLRSSLRASVIHNALGSINGASLGNYPSVTGSLRRSALFYRLGALHRPLTFDRRTLISYLRSLPLHGRSLTLHGRTLSLHGRMLPLHRRSLRSSFRGHLLSMGRSLGSSQVLSFITGHRSNGTKGHLIISLSHLGYSLLCRTGTGRRSLILRVHGSLPLHIHIILRLTSSLLCRTGSPHFSIGTAAAGIYRSSLIIHGGTSFSWYKFFSKVVSKATEIKRHSIRRGGFQSDIFLNGSEKFGIRKFDKTKIHILHAL